MITQLLQPSHISENAGSGKAHGGRCSDVFPFQSPRKNWALVIAVILFAVSLTVPSILAPLNRAWLRFGQLLHRIVNPVVMAILFFGVVTPIAVLRRAFVRDPFRLAREPEAETYWIERDPPGPAPETMTQQF